MNIDFDQAVLNVSEIDVSLTLEDKMCYVGVCLRSCYVTTLPDWTVP